MGRSVANESFLRALLARDPFDEYHFYLSGEGLMDRLAGTLRLRFPEVHGRGGFKVRVRGALAHMLPRVNYHCFHLSDCINHPAFLAALRNELSREVFPITGVTHSLSYGRYARDFLAQLWHGATLRDCVVGTSTTALEVVRAYYDFLSETFGDLPRPSLERIPLGVDAQALAPATDEERAQARERLGLAPGQSMILVFARLSHYSKMDLVPLLRAMQRLPSQGVRLSSVRLFVAGWVRKQEQGFVDTFKNLAANLRLPLTVVPCPDEAAKADLYRAADVFLSPVDNPQETFGLTILEAGAAGLPVVASDYDGYRDLVAHGETGFLAPTMGPADTRSLDRMAPLIYDNEYHLFLAQQTAVDVPSLARYLGRLLQDPELRRTMGRAARARVEERFTWEKVVDAYVDLWDRLWELPVEPPAEAGLHPLAVPFGRVFASYPTSTFDPELKVRWTRPGEAVYRGFDFVSVYRGLGNAVTPEDVRKVAFLARRPQALGLLLPKVAEILGRDEEQCRFLILWCLKNDYLERVHDGD
ncbi:glycosyltransferase family 4 protein [Desulfocurvus sp. DL9XJH121]